MIKSLTIHDGSPLNAICSPIKWMTSPKYFGTMSVRLEQVAADSVHKSRIRNGGVPNWRTYGDDRSVG
jgi:hypothetical protein